MSFLGSTSRLLADGIAGAQGSEVEREEHADFTLRLRKLATIGLVAWPLFGLVDWFVVELVEPGRLEIYLLLRGIGLALLAATAIRLHAPPLPSPLFARFADALLCTAGATLISLSCIEMRGIESPLVLGVVLIVLARGAVLADKWTRALLPVGLATLAHPIVLLSASGISPRIAQQLQDPRALATFALHELFLFGAGALTLVGGHAAWSLRRRIFRTRNLGRYRLQRKLAKGGMGEIWIAHHQGLNREVAIKILRPKDSADPRAADRFEREVRATALLGHPNVVRVYDYGTTEDGLCYYAMELLEGLDLKDLVTRDGAIEQARAVALIRQAADALSEAHARGIIHRDIKPENLFVTSAGSGRETLKVLDFGLAKLLPTSAAGRSGSGLTQVGWAVGTPTWLAPEIATSKPVDARTDVYALGCVLYFLVSGEPPFAGRDATATILAHVREAPMPLGARARRPVHPELERIVMRCLAKDPDSRYQTAKALAYALEACERDLQFHEWSEQTDSNDPSSLVPVSESTEESPVTTPRFAFR